VDSGENQPLGTIATEQSDDTLTPAKLRVKAMDLLARREYSCSELAKKLTTKLLLADEDQAILSTVLETLVKDDLLSDERFAESLVRSRVRKGHGPRRITQELHQCGIGAKLTALVLQDCGADWHHQAAAVADKKYGSQPANDIKETAKRSRFLQYRGFNAEQIAFALTSQRR